MKKIERYRGSPLGLACGDAVGTTLLTALGQREKVFGLFQRDGTARGVEGAGFSPLPLSVTEKMWKSFGEFGSAFYQ